MPRPPCCRRVSGKPIASVFRPAGIPACKVEHVTVTLDEFEALRLADTENLYQEAAAVRMRVSRATFGRILEAAHRKIADALVHGKLLKIEGGPVHQDVDPAFSCPHCSAMSSGKRTCPHCEPDEGARKGRKT
ncbi:MAG: DUF134 domain-containing protein [Deltaproteobacteria bacterium]|nr:DUF134 domain-containing protein [Deltaproteobacteria bacterium]